MSVRSILLESASRRNRMPAVNDPVMAGIRPATVISAGDSIRLRYADGTEETTLAGVTPALTAISQRTMGARAPTVIEEAWAMASATSIPSHVRAAELASLAAQASGEDAAKIRGWAVALLTGRPVAR